MRAVCECSMQNILGITLEDLKRVDWQTMQAAQGVAPELLRDCVSEVAFQYQVYFCFSRCNGNVTFSSVATCARNVDSETSTQ